FRHGGLVVGDPAVVGDLEDRGVGVLVDRDDHLGVLHPGQVLDGARDADGDVEGRGHDLAGLADLIVVGGVARVDRRARGADGGAQLVGQRVHDGVELFGRAQGAAARDDDLGGAQFGAVRLDHLFRDEGGLGRFAGGDALDRGRAAFSGGGEGRGAHGDDLLGVGRLDRLQRVARVDRPDEGVARDDLDDVRDRGHVQLGGEARGVILAVRGGGGQNGVIAPGQRQDGGFDRFGQTVGDGVAFGQQHLADARNLGGGFRDALGVLAQDQNVDVRRQRQGGRHGLVGGVANGRAVVVGDDENGHYRTPASLSLETSSAASATLTPAERFGGSVTLSTFRRSAVSTP